MKVLNMKNSVKMSKKMLFFRISVVFEREKWAFLGIILSDFTCILFGQKCFVIFRPIEMKLRFLIENELSFQLVLQFWRSDENCWKYEVFSVFFDSGGIIDLAVPPRDGVPQKSCWKNSPVSVAVDVAVYFRIANLSLTAAVFYSGHSSTHSVLPSFDGSTAD